MDDNEDNEDEPDEGEESDYEYMGGESANVNSLLDDIDELTFIRDAFGRIQDNNYINGLLQTMNPEEIARF